MAIIKCPECGKEISDTCDKCIHCGYQLKNINDDLSSKDHKIIRMYEKEMRMKLLVSFIGALFTAVAGVGLLLMLLEKAIANNEMVRKILLLCGIFLIVLGLAGSVYYFFKIKKMDKK